MYTQETINVLEALKTNERRVKDQNKQVKTFISEWNKSFKKLFKLNVR